jgi:hypothetical protein
MLCGKSAGEHETTYAEPDENENRVFAAKLERIKANSLKIPVERRVDDMIKSYEDGNPLTYTIDCGGNPAQKVVANIKTYFNHWDQNLVTQIVGSGVVGACLHDETHTGFINNVKTVDLQFHIMLDPSISVPHEDGSSFDKLIDETLFYHELLHGQLLINAIKNDANWKEKICSCEFSEEPTDGNHKIINPWEQDYLELIAKNEANVLVKRMPAQTAKGADGNFDIDLGNADDLLKDKEDVSIEFWYPQGTNMVVFKNPDNPEQNIPRVEEVDGHLRLIGKLQNPQESGFIAVKIDPPAYYIVFGIEETIVIEPAFGWTMIDNFESYGDFFNRIFDSWMDGWFDPNNGSTVGYPDPNFMSGEHFVETNIVHYGSQSMPFFYDNSVGISEATLILSSHKDWTQKAVNTLSLWFIGKVGNSIEPMYIVLNGSAVVYHDNPTAVAVAEWNEWKIGLQAFTDQGVDLTNVASFGIGFGNRENPQPGGSGLVFVDDIGLFCSQQ